MNSDIEERFVKKFVSSKMQDRIIFELKSAKKRHDAINKIFGNLNDRYIVLTQAKITDKDIFNEISKIYDTKSICYVFGNTILNGKEVKFETAFESVMYDAGAGIIVCGETVAFLKEEFAFGAPGKYLLNAMNLG